MGVGEGRAVQTAEVPSSEGRTWEYLGTKNRIKGDFSMTFRSFYSALREIGINHEQRICEAGVNSLNTKETKMPARVLGIKAINRFQANWQVLWIRLLFICLTFS